MRKLLLTIAAAGFAGGVFVPTAAAQSQADFVARMDTDIDGRVSLPEYTEYLSYAFYRMDADNNGVLEPNEQLVPNGKRLTLAEHQANLAEMFTKLDVSRDGFLSAKELAVPPPR